MACFYCKGGKCEVCEKGAQMQSKKELKCTFCGGKGCPSCNPSKDSYEVSRAYRNCR